MFSDRPKVIIVLINVEAQNMMHKTLRRNSVNI